MDLDQTDTILIGNYAKFIHPYKKTLKVKTSLYDILKNRKKDPWKKPKVPTFYISHNINFSWNFNSKILIIYLAIPRYT